MGSTQSICPPQPTVGQPMSSHAPGGTMSAGQEHTQVPNPAPAHSVWTGTSRQPAWALVSLCVQQALCCAAGRGRIPRTVRDRAGDRCDSLQLSTCSVAVVICPPGAWGFPRGQTQMGQPALGLLHSLAYGECPPARPGPWGGWRPHHQVTSHPHRPLSLQSSSKPSAKTECSRADQPASGGQC